MQPDSSKNAGIALVVFTVMLLFTMVLHPAGGDFQHLLRASTMLVITHSIAIASLPFGCIGFYGLTRKLGTENFFSILAFAFILLALTAVMLAACANGIVLPIFLHKYKDASPELIESIKPILKYNFSFNNAYDYIYTGAFCSSILFWSVAMLTAKRFSRWIALLGILLSIMGIGIGLSGLVTQLQGLRISLSGFIVWIVWVGFALIKNRN